MTTKKYDVAVVIGRFSPFHKGHQYLLDRALDLATQVIVLIGSADAALTAKNPFSAIKRGAMISAAMQTSRIITLPLNDHPYDDNAWIAQVQELVDNVTFAGQKIVLVGHIKDQSSYYLKMFPQWAFEALPGRLTNSNLQRVMDATRVRELLFTGDFAFIESAVPAPVYEMLMEWTQTDDYKRLKAEHEFVTKYKQQWANTPYPVNFVATDAVVVQSGHVLLIRRRSAPGEGLLALPGGYVDPSERLVDACLRELREETEIGIPDLVLRRSIVAERMFDDPNRNLHGRVMTMAYLLRLDDTKPLPKVNASDDAADALWVPLSQLDEVGTYSDHKHIIKAMLQKDPFR